MIFIEKCRGKISEVSLAFEIKKLSKHAYLSKKLETKCTEHIAGINLVIKAHPVLEYSLDEINRGTLRTQAVTWIE